MYTEEGILWFETPNSCHGLDDCYCQTLQEHRCVSKQGSCQRDSRNVHISDVVAKNSAADRIVTEYCDVFQMCLSVCLTCSR